MEDQKIRRYKIEDRESLRQMDKDNFDKAYNQYLADVECPLSAAPKNETLDWLLGLAVDFEFQENYQEFNDKKNGSESVECTIKNNPLDHLDCELKLTMLVVFNFKLIFQIIFQSIVLNSRQE